MFRKRSFYSVKDSFTAFLKDVDYNFQNYFLKDKLDSKLALKKGLVVRFDVFS